MWPRHVLERFCVGKQTHLKFYRQTITHLHMRKGIRFVSWQKFQSLTSGRVTNVFAFTMCCIIFHLKRDFFCTALKGEEFGCCFECLYTFNEVTVGLTGAIIGKIK